MQYQRLLEQVAKDNNTTPEKVKNICIPVNL